MLFYLQYGLISIISPWKLQSE